MRSKTRIAVIGPGAVGGYFGGRLAEAGEEVVFVARGRTLEALREHGLSIESPLGDAHLQPVQATDEPREIGPVDWVLVTVKAWQVPEAAESLRPLVGEGTAVLPLQNGVEAPAHLATVLGPGPVLGGLCKILSQTEGPGRIRHLAATPFIELGELSSETREAGEPGERTERLAEILRQAGIEVRVSPDIEAAMWEKFLFITALGAVGAVTRAPVGVMRNMSETRALLQQAMEEIRAVAVARGVALADDAIERTFRFLESLPEDGTASMQRDLMEGRPSELESQPGAVVRLAREAGVAVPLHTTLYHALLPAERAARSR